MYGTSLNIGTRTCPSSTEIQERCPRGHRGNDSRREIRPRLRIGPLNGTRRKGLCSFLRDRRRPSSMMRSIEWKPSCSRDAPNSSSTYQNGPINRGSVMIGVKIDGFPSPPRIRGRPADIAQLAPEARTRLPHSGSLGHTGATSGPRTSRSQRTTAVTTGPASAQLTRHTPPFAAGRAVLLGSLTRKRSQVQTLSRPPHGV